MVCSSLSFAGIFPVDEWWVFSLDNVHAVASPVIHEEIKKTISDTVDDIPSGLSSKQSVTVVLHEDERPLDSSLLLQPSSTLEIDQIDTEFDQMVGQYLNRL